ncbi:MAG: SPOR domain-containing protein [Devosia nanyangense]|uniref:SPOR domain-containing protein n=1 Tax=Devosia nanyangense TaxID=1228055 RepID=A0A933NXQ6_9HYPH|nr:SPOR domain-containing protein [Devosia nanyangense]
MPPARPQQMSDPADKSDDLIAELAKLMASGGQGNEAAVRPPARPAPLDPNATAPAPTPIRIPGMDAAPAAPRPAPAAPAPATPAAAAQPAPRAPVTGSIRIPGMDQPAPVSTSAPVSKFDFGKPMAAPVIKQEPLSSLADRIAARAAESEANPARVEPSFAAAPPPVRMSSELRPVSENKSFAEGPALVVAKPAPAPAPEAQPAKSDFNFDFGFGQQPPASDSPPRPGADPIADLIAMEMGEAPITDLAHEEAPPAKPEPRPVQTPMTQVVRTTGAPQAGPAKPVFSTIAAGAPRPAANAPIPLKPVSVAPRSPDSDRFAISPGVGLNMKPPATQPLNPQPRPHAPEPAPAAHTESDPMSEIENLIGEAVRVELSAPGPIRVQTPQQVAPKVEFEAEADVEREIGYQSGRSPAPVVPPLTTQFAPRRTGLRDDGAASAEDAILAAAAATGAEVGRIDAPNAEESPYRRLKVKPQRASFLSGGMRQYIGMAVAGTLLLAAGLGLYWVLNMGRSVNSGAAAPQLTADATPVKEVPSAPATTDTETARSPVLQQMGGASQAPSAEQLVSTDETGGADVTRDVTPAAGDSESGLANRKVRTVTVRPDGTIVSGDDAVAGTEELPVDRPNVPDVPSAETTNLLGTDTEIAATDPIASAIADSATAPASTTDATTAVADIQPVIDPSIVAPTPLPRPAGGTAALAFTSEAANPVNAVVTGAQTPNGQIDLLGGGNETQVAVAEPTAPANAAAAAAYVQLSSSPSEGDAQASLKSATSRWGSLFGDSKLIVQSADLGQKGTWYRVRLPTSSLSEANRICAEIKAGGGDCIATGG